MAAVVGSLLVELQADSNPLSKALSVAGRDVTNYEARATRSFAKADKAAATSFSSMGKSASVFSESANLSLGRLAGAFAGVFTVGATKNAIDSATKISNALKVAGLSGDELTKTFDALYEVAQRNSVPIEALAKLYSRVSINQKELGVSSSQLVGFADDVAKALRVTGTSAEEAEGGLLQLSQALGSGTVHAEEFNSILESMPALAQAAAKGIKQANGSVAQLKQLVVVQKLSSRALFDGIIAGAGDLDSKLQNTDKTFSQMVTNLENSAIRAAGELNKSTAVVSTFGTAIDEVATFIDGINFDKFAGEIGKIASAWENALKAAQSYIANATDGTVLPKIGEALVNSLPGTGNQATSTVKQIGPDVAHANIYSQDAVESRINDAFKDAGTSYVTGLDAAAIRASTAAGANGGIQSPALKADRVKPSFTPITPIDLNDPKYIPTGAKTSSGGKSSGGSKLSADDKSDEDLQALRDRTTALKDEISTIGLDYEAQTRRSTALDLEQKALKELRQEALRKGQTDLDNIKLSPDKISAIQQESAAYAKQAAALQNVRAKQEKADAAAEEFYGTVKESLIGAIEGTNSFSDALGAIAKKLEDMALNSVFDSLFSPKTSSAAGGIFGSLLGGVGSLFGFEDGGYTGNGGRKAPAGFVHGKEYVFDADTTAKIGPDNLDSLRSYVKTGRTALPGFEKGGYVADSNTLKTPEPPASMTSIMKNSDSLVGSMSSKQPAPIAHFSVDVSGARGNQEITEMVHAGVTSGIAAYNKQLPDRIGQINRNPGRR